MNVEILNINKLAKYHRNVQPDELHSFLSHHGDNDNRDAKSVDRVRFVDEFPSPQPTRGSGKHHTTLADSDAYQQTKTVAKTHTSQTLSAFCDIFRLFFAKLTVKRNLYNLWISNLTKIVIWYKIWAKMICDFGM